MKNLFSVIPEDFFKPLTGKYKDQYADCLLTIYNSYKSEISFGVDRETIVAALTEYFGTRNDVISFDDDINFERDARSKAQGTINYLKKCGWLDFEDEKNYVQNVILTEQAVPFIKTMSDIIKNEETEYQGLISQIHAVLQNKELYVKPYQFILKNVAENTDRLVSALKKLSISIKKHIEKQTKHKDLAAVLELFASYNDEIISKSLYRLKTSENVGRFRQSIKINLDKMLNNSQIMERLADGYMEIEQEGNKDKAMDKITEIIIDVKNSFENLDKIIKGIDDKNIRYTRNAAARAKFELSGATNQAGKINTILRYLTEATEDDESVSDDIFEIYTQKFISEESIKKLPERKNYGKVAVLQTAEVLSESEKALKKKMLLDRQLSRFYRKKIEDFVKKCLVDKDSFMASEIPINNRKDFENLIYIRIFADESNVYSVAKTNHRVKTDKVEFKDFRILKKGEMINV